MKAKIDPSTDESVDCYYIGAENNHQHTICLDLRYCPVEEE